MVTQIDLPLEILERFVDSLAITNDPTIKAFALVCRATLPMCRKHIFASIRIHGHRGRTISSLCEILTQSPHLAPFIRTLLFNLSKSHDQSQLPGVFKIFQRLTRLQSLALWPSNSRIINSWTVHRDLLLPLLHLPTITDLALWRITDFPISDLIPCLSLKKLRVIDSPLCGISDNSSPSPVPDNTRSIGVENFEWTCTRQVEAMPSIYHAQRPDGKLIIDFSGLKVLHLSLLGHLELHSLKDLFGNCHQLIELHMAFGDSQSTTQGLFEIVEGSMQTLRRLRVEYKIDDTPEHLLDPFSHH